MTNLINFYSPLTSFPFSEYLNRPVPAGQPAEPAAAASEPVRNQVSNDLIALSRAGVDYKNSQVVARASSFQFDLRYQSQEAQEVSTSGVYYSQSRSLDFSLHFEYTRAGAGEEGVQAQTVAFDFSYSVQVFREVSVATDDEGDESVEKFVKEMKEDYEDFGEKDKFLKKLLKFEDAVQFSRYDEDKLTKKFMKLARKAFDFAKIKNGHDHDRDEHKDHNDEDKVKAYEPDNAVQQSYSRMVRFSMSISTAEFQIAAPDEQVVSEPAAVDAPASPAVDPSAVDPAQPAVADPVADPAAIV